MRCPMSLPFAWKESRAARGRHHLLETDGLGARHLAAERRQLVRPAAFVAVAFRGQLDDQLVVQEALDQAVERPGAQANVAAGTLLDFFENQVTVLGASGQRQQHVEGRRRQRQVGGRLEYDGRHMALDDMSSRDIVDEGWCKSVWWCRAVDYRPARAARALASFCAMAAISAASQRTGRKLSTRIAPSTSVVRTAVPRLA